MTKKCPECGAETNFNEIIDLLCPNGHVVKVQVKVVKTIK